MRVEYFANFASMTLSNGPILLILRSNMLLEYSLNL